MDIWSVLGVWGVLGLVAVLLLARVLRRTSQPEGVAGRAGNVTGSVHRLIDS
jgi:hypothetical protein